MRILWIWQRNALTLLLVTFGCLLATIRSLTPNLLGSTVAGIDFGSHFVKISYVAPGENEPEPLPIMLNDMSERKTVNAVAFRNGQTFVGPHALKPILNQPERGYLWLNTLLGRNYEDPRVQDTLKFTAAKFKPDTETGSITAETLQEDYSPVEHLSAILLSKLVDQTEADSERLIREAIITVPPYFGQAQRQSILDVAKIAGLKVLSLINDISAASLYYGSFSASKLERPVKVILFDSGATHTSAALVSVDPNYKEGTKTLRLIEVLRTVSNLQLNGLAIDRAVTKILSLRFKEATGTEIPIGKAYNRLIAEANNVKHILSANTDIRVTVEELVGDHSLTTKISRVEIEAECADMKHLASDLIQSLLKEGNVEISDIHAIIPIGGNSRVPFIQENLREKFGDKIQFVLNMDETTAKGAAWYAASLSGFRMKPMRFRDSHPYQISVSYKSLSPDESTDGINSVLVYPPNSFVEGHKGISFKKMDSVSATLVASEQGSLMTLDITGMPEALESVKDKQVISSKMKFWVDLNSSGIIDIQDQPVAIVEYEVTQPKVNPSNSTAPANNDTTIDTTGQIETETIRKQDNIPLNRSIKLLYNHLSQETISKCRDRYYQISLP